MTEGARGPGWAVAVVAVWLTACSAPAPQEPVPPGCTFDDAALPHEVDVPPARRNANAGDRILFGPPAPPPHFRPSPPPGRLVRVRVRLRVDTDGRVTDGCVLEATTPKAGALVMERIREYWRYLPATRDGRPVPAVALETVEETVGPSRNQTLQDVLRTRTGDAGPWKPLSERRRVFESTDVAWLERAATDPLLPHTIDVRKDAYARLGELGTPTALDAVERIDRAFADTAVATARAGVVREPYVSGGLGVRWAVWTDRRYAGHDVVLSWSVGSGPWARPRLVPLSPGLAASGHVTATWDGDTMVIRQVGRGVPRRDSRPCPVPGTCGAGAPGYAQPRREVRSWRLDIAGILRDSDGDGWTDLEEQRFGIDPHSPDTDRDGTADGRDVCPALAAPAAPVGSEDHAILSTAAFAILGLTRLPGLMLPVPDTPEVHLWGLAGPVLYGRPRPRFTDPGWSGGGRSVFWEISDRAVDVATVRIDQATGGMAGEGHFVYLRRMRNRWYVVATTPDWIS